MSTIITICLIGFAIVFAELYSIRKMAERQEQRHKYHEDTVEQFKQLKYEADRQNNSLQELIEIIEESKIPLTDYGKSSLKTAKAIVRHYKCE